MRRPSLTFALTAALLLFAGNAEGQQQQAVPDAPQPQKKPAPKPPADAAPVPDAPAAKPPAGKDDNAFPEAVSQEAAAKAASQDDSKDAGAPTPGAGPRPPVDANPFPEDVSRDAAKAAGNEAPAADVPKESLPGDVSSSQSNSLSGQESEPSVIDPARAQKDTEVGSFYLKTKDYQGALLRFQRRFNG